jgi:rare lipoprotein A (peptidoglycan hydrolase)
VSCEYRPVALRWDFGQCFVAVIGVVVAAAMFGCSEQRAPEDQYSAPAPYQSYSSVPRRGRLEVASWYGPGFVGHITSDGEIFNPNELTAASKTLPIGSRVRVTNPDNGRSVVVRINDRGPYVRGRNLDLSRSAARDIGLTAEGVGRVRVSAVGRVGPASNAASPAYIRRTTYHQSAIRPSRRRRVSKPPGLSSD